MKKILIASYDMEVGGVERSLVSMLDHFDYDRHSVDLMLYKHQGEFMELLNRRARLLEEVPQYASFRKSIGQLLKERQFGLGVSRVLSKVNADLIGRLRKSAEPGYFQMQLMWKYALPMLPKLDEEYDAAISYLWPHYFVADKIRAKRKFAWIHTDYSTVETNRTMDLKMWAKFDRIAAVSEACRDSFLSKYPELADKTDILENITSPEFIKRMASQGDAGPLQADDRFKLITVARLSHAKGIDQAVKAMKLLKERGLRDLVWYIVGYGGDEAMIKELIASYGLEKDFILLGKQTNPYPYIQAGDLYVQPSRYEGKAVTVTEAKILGKPILITNYPTAPSQVEEGKDGLICQSSPEGLADGIEKLYKSHEIRSRLAAYVRQTNYSNGYELDKLYKWIS
ncbi:glycosyltransferase [Paenibacillus aurantius]|uniref:Glycosyltransferase n=1 Tax=Paenibacillus aurantius TaxID=2918900 RepID=A0AA96REP6_9BACL|nr:glycosyltransferase [Paenibacillus aurantius]WNQ12685.1 glycosyltransferase [Paenibacillus aurantius]